MNDTASVTRTGSETKGIAVERLTLNSLSERLDDILARTDTLVNSSDRILNSMGELSDKVGSIDKPVQSSSYIQVQAEKMDDIVNMLVRISDNHREIERFIG